MTFQRDKYQVLENAISYELANFCFNYFLLKRDAVKYMYDNNIIAENGLFGTWKDQQVPNTYSIYADQVMETLLMKVLPSNETKNRIRFNSNLFLCKSI
jgi:hypothetical protein